MSYILNALRRSESERQRDQAPSIHAAGAQEGAATAPPRRPLRALAYVLFALLLLGLIIAVGYGLSKSRDGGAVVDEPAAPPVTVATPAPVPVAPTVTAPAAPEPEQPDEIQIETPPVPDPMLTEQDSRPEWTLVDIPDTPPVPDPGSENIPNPEEIDIAVDDVDVPPTPADTQVLRGADADGSDIEAEIIRIDPRHTKALAGSEPPDEVPAFGNPLEEMATQLQQARDEIEAAGRSRPEPDAGAAVAPNLRELSLAQQGRVPRIAISTHLYAPDPAGRRARINGQMLREGASLGDGLRVHEITPDGVVFEQGGQQFSLGIGQNWPGR